MRGVPFRGVRCARREGGAALVIALLLVLVGTLIGVSAMQTSTVETRLVANERFRQSAFGAAESAVERALFAVDVGALPGNAAVALDAPDVGAGIALEVRARAQGQSLRVGTSARVLVNTLYAVEATATIDAVDARRTVVQGASRPSVPR